MLFIIKVIKGWRTKRAKEALEKYRTEALLKLEEEGEILDDPEEQLRRFSGPAENKPQKLSWAHFRDWIKRNTPLWLLGLRKNYNWIRFRKKLGTYGTIENFYVKSIAGFLCGILVMYVTFLFFVFPLAMPLTKATVMSVILGLPCMVLLAFNEAARCVVLMLIPHLFSSKGRQALAAYAILLTFSEPGRNAIHNVRILSDSLACGQEKANQLLKAVIALVKQPFVQIKKTMSDVMKRIERVVKKMKGSIDSIKRVMSSIIDVIQTAFDWLNNVVSLCSKKLGTPFQRCSRAFDNAIDDCNAKLGSWFNWMCSVAYITKTVCYVVKVIDYICAMFEFVSDEIVVRAKRRLREFVYHVRNLFYVSIEFSHESSYEMSKSQEVSDVLFAIAADFKRMFAELFGWLDGGSVFFSFFMFFCIYSAYRYRKKFISREWYDNHFLTSHLIEIEIRRTGMDRETIFPLSRWEKTKYIQLTSLKLVGLEKIKMAALLILMAWLFAKIGLIILSDFSVWWLINKVKNYASQDINIEGLNPIEVNVSDTGVMSDVYKGIVDSFQPKGVNVDVDTSSCVPVPEDPAYFAYKQLAVLLVFIFIMTLYQPYGQRLRIIIMNYYYPSVARRRAVWLYNNILRSRGSFLKYARRQLRRKFAHDTDIETVSIQDRIFAVLPFLRLLFPKRKFEACLVCGTPSSPGEPLMQCQSPNCVGLYCVPCFNTLQNVCTICKSPIDYGDMSDLSEERDSSDYFDNLEKELFGERKGDILESDINVSEGYESDYDTTYQKEKRSPSDVPITSIDVDYMESQGRATNLAAEDIFELTDEQKTNEATFRRSIEMTLKNRISVNPFKNVFGWVSEPCLTVEPSKRELSPNRKPSESPRGSKTSRATLSHRVSSRGSLPKRIEVTSISETGRLSSKADDSPAPNIAVTIKGPKPNCFGLFSHLLCKKKSTTKISEVPDNEGSTSDATVRFTQSKASPSVRSKSTESTAPTIRSTTTPESKEGVASMSEDKEEELKYLYSVRNKAEASARTTSRLSRKKRTPAHRYVAASSRKAPVTEGKPKWKLKLPDLTQSLMKLVPDKWKSKRIVPKYERVQSQSKSSRSTPSSYATTSSTTTSSSDEEDDCSSHDDCSSNSTSSSSTRTSRRR